MEIIVDRASVCAGDDVDGHQQIFLFPEDATYEDLCSRILEERYLASVSGNNVVWVLSSKEHFCIFSYFTRTGKISRGMAVKRLSELCRNDKELKFKYYSSPDWWKQSIIRWYKNDTDAMGRDGWQEELKYCDFVTALGLER